MDGSPVAAVQTGSEELVQGPDHYRRLLLTERPIKLAPRLRANLQLLVVPIHAKQPHTKSAAHNNVVRGR